LTFLVAACGSSQEKNPIIKMATTTSVQDSGLLDVLLPIFEKETGYKVHVIAVGSGKAIKHGENGDVDVLFTHDPDAEEKFVNDGFGINKRAVMYNDFIIVGPEEDPAKVKGAKDAAEALEKIASGEFMFISRGDESGTHVKEKKLWAAACVTPSGKWYVAAGQGMGAVLVMADEKKAYALTDRGTYLAQKGKISLSILCEGDKKLLNKYSIMAVNPQKHPHVNIAGASALVDWFVSSEAQQAIANYKKSGNALFIPDAGN
jgi:tungstate transport system substrate-binding protein